MAIGGAIAALLVTGVALNLYAQIGLVFASGAGAFGQRSLGIPVFGGMLAALLIGTFFIPGFYAIVQGLRERLKGTVQR